LLQGAARVENTAADGNFHVVAVAFDQLDVADVEQMHRFERRMAIAIFTDDTQKGR
jgi:hypothetical protein